MLVTIPLTSFSLMSCNNRLPKFGEVKAFSHPPAMLTEYVLNTSLIIYSQKAATDALQLMTEVLKNESSAGKSYEALYNGAKSLATGLGSILRVLSYRARSYDIRNSNQDSPNLYRRRKQSSGEWILSFVGLTARQRPKRDAIKEQAQARKEVR